MKKLLTIGSLLTLSTTLMMTTLTPVQAEPNSYVLMCKAGRGMSVDYRGNKKFLIVNFKAGDSAGENGVDSGSCTWVDRGFRNNEPTSLCQWGVNDVRIIMNAKNKVTRLTSDKAPYIKKIQQGRSFQVRVYNDGKGCMKVTKPSV